MAGLWRRTNRVIVRVARPAPTKSGRATRGGTYSFYRRHAGLTSSGCFCLQSLRRHYLGWGRFIRCTHMRWFPAFAVQPRPTQISRLKTVCRCQRQMTKAAPSQ